MDAAVALAAVALIAAFVVPGAIEAFKRPRLSIVPSPWSPAGPVAWTFAAIQVHNRPLGAPFNRFLMREAAQRCVVDLDFFRWGTDERVMETVPGRWSSHHEPIQMIPSPPAAPAPYSGGTATLDPNYQAFTGLYDPTLDPANTTWR